MFHLLKHAALASVAVISSAAALANDGGIHVPHDYTWTSQSKNSSESMPVGGHDIGLNVWVENGDLLIYMCQSGWLDENNTLLKAGRLRLRFSDNVLAGSDFRQNLEVSTGLMTISCADMSINIWSDATSPDIYIQVDGKKKRHATLSYESWRTKDEVVPPDARMQCAYKWLSGDCMMYADSVSPSAHSVKFSHVNRQETIFDRTVAIEGLDPIKASLYNPLAGLEMKGEMSVPALKYTGISKGKYIDTDFTAWNYEGDAKKFDVHVRLTSYPDAPAAARKPADSRLRTAYWWADFWSRSHIYLPRAESNLSEPEPTDSAAVILRNYDLMRFMLGCNASGRWVTKFNGGLFTFDPSLVDPSRKFTPDYRCWGGGTQTAQNQRLVYWPMVKSGDLQMLRVQLDAYKRMLGNATARTRFYWGHDGASFTEQMECFGLPNPAEYGEHAPGQDRGVESNAWLEYLWDTSLEFCMMALEANKYQNMDIADYEELIWQCLLFFDEHYQYEALKLGKLPLAEGDKLVIYPGAGAETHKMAYNPCSTVAALQVVGQAWVDYATKVGKPADVIAKAKTLVSHVPEIPFRYIDGHKVIAPAVAWARINNVETTQMYPVFPWRVFGVGRPDLQVAIDTWTLDPWSIEMKSARGWKQDNIWAACLGLADEAAKLNYEKMANGPYRFPAFYDMGFDWAPDFNRGGSGMIGIQEMVMQRTPDGQIIDLPAWPARWGKVVYKLY